MGFALVEWSSPVPTLFEEHVHARPADRDLEYQSKVGVGAGLGDTGRLQPRAVTRAHTHMIALLPLCRPLHKTAAAAACIHSRSEAHGSCLSLGFSPR